MNEAKIRFFENMDKDMENSGHTANNIDLSNHKSSSTLEIEFSVTESGRTVAHMVTDTNRSMESNGMDFSITQSARSMGDLSYMGLTESDRGVLLEAFGPESSTLEPEKNDPPLSSALSSVLPPVVEERKPPARSIPVPKPNHNHHLLHKKQPMMASLLNSHPPLPSSQPNSYGSSGSAFLSSVLNATPGTSYGSQPALAASIQSTQYPMFSHTPPAASSYEVSHFGKRARSSSVSGKLRSASDYLEERGLLDRQTKGVLNDLFLIGDPEMQTALDQYESGDPSALERMIQSGALQNRLPKDIDILGGIDFDFLTVHDDDTGGPDLAELEALQHHEQQRLDDHHHQVIPPAATAATQPTRQQTRSQPIPVVQNNRIPQSSHPGPGHFDHHQGQRPPPPPHMVSPSHQTQYGHHDDGIGELDFAGDFVSDHQYSMDFSHPTGQSYGSSSQLHPSAAASPIDGPLMADFERRNRSNSLFSALLNDPTQHPQPLQHMQPPQQQLPQRHRSETITSLGTLNTQGTHNTASVQYGEWMDSSPTLGSTILPIPTPGIRVGSGRQPKTPKATAANNNARSTSSGLTNSLEADRKRNEREQKRKDKELKQLERKEKKERKQQLQLIQQKAKEEEDKREEHVTGCGRPRSLSDPLLKTTKDEHGMMQVERPDGWVGAYSPDSRKVRLERFLEKRKHRVWTQSVKYDVRKNFADSRLRVKGRFVKKEDEMLMRELMSMT